MDTPLVNGTAYPYLTVEPKAYRFRILNACNDRILNLQLYYAESNAHHVEPRRHAQRRQCRRGRHGASGLDPRVHPATTGRPTAGTAACPTRRRLART